MEQVGEETIKQLLNLDLANKPEAQKPLIQFLTALGVSAERIQTSAIGKTIANAEAYKEMIEKQGSVDLGGTGI
jgi:hypothetical protein